MTNIEYFNIMLININEQLYHKHTLMKKTNTFIRNVHL